MAQLASGGHAELLGRRIEVVGDLAYEIGIEKGEATLAGEQIAIEQRVTYIYRREADAGRSSITTPTSHRRWWPAPRPGEGRLTRTRARHGLPLSSARLSDPDRLYEVQRALAARGVEAEVWDEAAHRRRRGAAAPDCA